jgi:hypothetical protein
MRNDLNWIRCEREKVVWCRHESRRQFLAERVDPVRINQRGHFSFFLFGLVCFITSALFAHTHTHMSICILQMWLSTFPGQRRRSFHRLCHYLALERFFEIIQVYLPLQQKEECTQQQIFITFFSIFTFRRNTQHRSRRHGPARSLAPRANLFATVYICITRTTNFLLETFFQRSVGFVRTHGSLSPVVLYSRGGLECIRLIF